MATLDHRLASIFGRRSVRAFTTQAVGDDMVELVLQAAMAAPSACARDPWRFVVVRDKSILTRIAEGLPNGKMLASASVGLVVCGDLSAAHDGQVSYMLQDCSAAVQNVLLAAHMLGMGACWLGVHPREDRMVHVQHTLAIPEGVIPVTCIAVGYPAESKEPRTRYNTQFVHHDKW